MNVQDFIDAVSEALGRGSQTLSLDDTPETVEEWDSVGHLSIIAMLDELGVSLDDDEMRKFNSIREIVDRLKVMKVLEE